MLYSRHIIPELDNRLLKTGPGFELAINQPVLELRGNCIVVTNHIVHSVLTESVG